MKKKIFCFNKYYGNEYDFYKMFVQRENELSNWNFSILMCPSHFQGNIDSNILQIHMNIMVVCVL